MIAATIAKSLSCTNIGWIGRTTTITIVGDITSSVMRITVGHHDHGRRY